LIKKYFQPQITGRKTTVKGELKVNEPIRRPSLIGADEVRKIMFLSNELLEENHHLLLSD